MYRRVVLYNKKTWVSGAVEVLYHVRGARQLAQNRETTKAYDESIGAAPVNGAVAFADSIRLRAANGISPVSMFEFVLEVPENQPAVESVEEITTTGSTIVVFNENGVVTCSNDVGITASSAPTQTVAPGEMTSVPGEEPGEMTSEPIEAPGEMTSVPGEEPGEMVGETTDDPGTMI